MSTVNWRGAAPPALLAHALRAAGLTIVRGRREAVRGPTVIFTLSGRPPAVPDGTHRWLWVSAAAISPSRAVDAVMRGAYAAVALTAADAATQLVARLQELSVPDPSPDAPPHIVVESAVSRALVAQVARVAPTSMAVLITGETGTGKEVVARLLHSWSPRRQKPFVPINCAAIPNDLMEAELFGYARGAFSGAVQRYDGQLMAAAGGTVFLDEIDDTPLETQTKLLRVVEDRVVSRLGENVWHEVDFRLLAATNRACER